jgi:hypothetical protein
MALFLICQSRISEYVTKSTDLHHPTLKVAYYIECDNVALFPKFRGGDPEFSSILFCIDQN